MSLSTPRRSRWRSRVRHPGRWRGAAIAVAGAALVLWLWVASELFISDAPLTSVRLLGSDVLVAAAVGGVVALLLRFTIGLRWGVPALFLGAVVFAVILLAFAAGPTLIGWAALCAVLLVAAGLIGYLLGGTGTRRRARQQPDGGAHVAAPRAGTARATRVVALVATVAAVVALGLMAWAGPGAPTWPRQGEGSAATSATTSASSVGVASRATTEARSTLPPPGQAGPYAVESLTYGAGGDLHRTEYAQPQVRSRTVDATGLLHGWSGGAGSDRTALWGFDASRFPLNAMVWRPRGDGRFPLVLIAHGNSSAQLSSEGGFAYLGQHLASHGYIVAAVDLNFLNTNLIDRAGGLDGASATRAWLLLEHLRQWREWGQSGSGLGAHVDLKKITLMGHSRGGEAVATAAQFNSLDADPDNHGVRFDFGFDIASVVAIAPSDSLYTPGGRPVTLPDLSYLAMQGSHDGDIRSFVGLNQLHRMEPAPRGASPGPSRRAAIKLYRADHVQFNTLWGRTDPGQGLAKHFYDTASLLSEAEQQGAARTIITAFLQSTVRGEHGYDALFTEPSAQAAWLPNVAAVDIFDDGSGPMLADFEGASGGATQSAAGVSVTATPLPRQASVGSVGRLDWQQGATAVVTYTPAEPLPLTKRGISLDIAAVSETAPPVSLRLRDRRGAEATVALAQFGRIPGPMPGRYLKAQQLQAGSGSESMLQTIRVPASAFRGVDLAAISSVAIVPDTASAGSLYLDNVRVAS